MVQLDDDEHFKLIPVDCECWEDWTYQYLLYNMYCISGRQTRCNIVVIVWDVIEYYTKNINSGADITNSLLIRLARPTGNTYYYHITYNYEIVSCSRESSSQLHYSSQQFGLIFILYFSYQNLIKVTTKTNFERILHIKS